ncbi:glycosyltransferase family 4 protein [Diaphorobacter aerolatus]|uniref:Glycosyltransferase family 4 protein n=1 Tax=Diaphorobacter aerolatus TaxID=1288495 RepID=A0A7H0GFU4_9BURK|nr:glycosyltransferase family 4 protein [Diaphorobacter aerolatus]QNP47160.1 glycosyltransferase family 4 protein [Diaphorobacter aerolatus]
MSTPSHASTPTESTDRALRRPRVLHFVTGGFSGATQVAVDLVRGHLAGQSFEPLLVLRRKPHTEQARVDALLSEGIPVEMVAGWAHIATVRQLVKICERFRPDILVAHGFSEHLWGRYAGLLAKVPHLVHVEHNSRERYTWSRTRQMLWLSRRTDAIVGCSEGVKQVLLDKGTPVAKTLAISNGIRTAPFAAAVQHSWRERIPGIIMAARFARQKDHTTLLRAIALLRSRGHRPSVKLAGAGKASARNAAHKLSAELGLTDQVEFLGHHKDVPGLLMTHQICVLSTHYEGMPLSLIEGMAAGCVAIGTRAPGVQEVIDHDRNGLLVAHEDAASLADALERVLTRPEDGERLAAQGRADADTLYTLERMIARYETLFGQIIAGDEPLDLSRI